jgi:hypothetical protein
VESDRHANTTNHSGSVLSTTEPQRSRRFAGREGGTVLAASKRRLKERSGLVHGNLPIAGKKGETKGNKCVGGMFLRCHDKNGYSAPGYEKE